MTTPYPFREAFQEIARRCEALFVVETVQYGPAASRQELVAELKLDAEQNDSACGEGAAEQVLTYGQECNGFNLRWQYTAAQQAAGTHHYSGIIELLSVGGIYVSWQADLYVDTWAEHDPALGKSLRGFHLVDMFADPSFVGIYCNVGPAPELYYYTDGEGELPAPLGIGLAGYVELLKLSLGYQHWQLLLVELNEYFNTPAPREPFRYQSSLANARYFVEDMTKLNPEFTLEKFMARYDEVRLRR